MKKLLLAMMTLNSISLLGNVTVSQQEATQKGWPGIFPVTCTKSYETKVCNDYTASGRFIGTRCGGPVGSDCTASDETATPGSANSCNVSNQGCNARAGQPLVTGHDVVTILQNL